MSYDWAMFFEEYAGELNSTFKKELSSQLLAKGNLTGIKNFEKYNFQLMYPYISLFENTQLLNLYYF